MAEGGGEKEKVCCISHEFFKVASENPRKIAVVHALGGSRVCRDLRQSFIEDPGFVHDDEFFDVRRDSPSKLSYKGDDVFTFSQVLESVEDLSYRIRCVLDGGDDPNTIEPRGELHDKGGVRNVVNESSSTVGLTEEQSGEVQEMGTSPRIVGIYIVPSVEYVVSVLSVLRCGEAFLPLDPSWPKERIQSIVSSAKVDLIIKCESCPTISGFHQVDRLNWKADCSGCSVLYMSMKRAQEQKFDFPDLGWPCESRKRRLFCYLMYTSGSTGKPKGVCGTEKGLLNRFLWMQELFHLHGDIGEEILLFKTPVSFIDHLQEFLTAILTCTPLVIPPFEDLKANPLYIVDFVQAYHISRLTVVPSLMRAMLPAIQNHYSMRIQRSLRVLVLSGEVLPISLWSMLSKLLPEATILNLYGSTEVAGDCTYFNCTSLPMILETEKLSSVPIGVPIVNCDVVLIGEEDEPNEGEIHVGGLCTSIGYFMDPDMTSLDYVKLPPFLDAGTHLYFRTGDFARRLNSGDLVFLGRKDRTIKFNGQRVALEEIENVLRDHPDVYDAAVISHKDESISAYIGAYIVLKRKDDYCDTLISSIRSLLSQKLPPAMIPSHYLCIDSLPLSSTGKVDYASLSGSAFFIKQLRSNTDTTQSDHGLLQVIKEAFCEVLMVEEVANDTDFFVMGGNSIGAAQIAYKFGINMSLLYNFPTPYKFLFALQESEPLYKHELSIDGVWKLKMKKQKTDLIKSFDVDTPVCNNKSLGSSSTIVSGIKDDSPLTCKYLKADLDMYSDSNGTTKSHSYPWITSLYNRACAFSRCNKVVCDCQDGFNSLRQVCWSVQIRSNRKSSIRDLWKVNLGSCVDASPLVVLKDGGVYVFIGSHSYVFLCIDAISGLTRWEVKLEGRIECSAAIIDDFSQVVVGCYKGKLYFLDFWTGNISWTFQTGGEVKSQPVVDKLRKLVWFGSYDHNLYALDYNNHCCVYSVSCGGSIYGSPSMDMVHEILYVASTRGGVTALSTKASPFNIKWVHELGSPVFGSLSTVAPHGNVICCSVDGRVVVLNLSGSIVWKAITGGPIFAGACISCALPSQVLICSRNGSVYSFDLETGGLIWEYNVGDPITSSAYVDENIELISDPSHPSDRLACICSSSGSIYVLRINLKSMKQRNQMTKNSLEPTVHEFAKMDLPGDIFSSPVMIGGRIFVGCRDDYIHCIEIETLNEKRDQPN